MMGTRLMSPKMVLHWIICVVWITAAGEDVPCPRGGQIHLSSMRCYWISEKASSWSEAQDSCRETQGGDLASADSLESQNFIYCSFPLETSVWVWLKGPEGGGSEGSEGGCAQMALGTLGQRRTVLCAGQYFYLCEKEVTEALPSVDSYLTGLVLMTGVYVKMQINLLPSVPDIGQHTVEIQLFPGVWFTHAGHLVTVELVVQPSPLSSLARVQILRPYCDPNHHLVPPGCSSLHNPFSCCSAVPLCNTTGGCSMGQYWCHLLEACVPTTSPCSPYDPAAGGRGFSLPPRYPAMPPFYHIVADLPLRINPSTQLKTTSLRLPDSAIMVYPDDIVAVQHTRPSGTFLHCLNDEASQNSSWRQSYLSLRRAEWGGWWQGGLSQGGQWVDGVMCNLRMLYMDTLHGGTEVNGLFDVTHTEATTAPDIRPSTTDLSPRPKFWLIHPLPDEKNQIHVQVNLPTLIVIKVLSCQSARSSWSAPVLQTGVPFLQSCPEELASSWPGCRRQSPEDCFSSVTLLLASVGVQTLNISVTDFVSSQSVTVKVCGYEAVTGLSVEPHGHLRILIDTSQTFAAKVEGGSSVKFTWVIDNLKKFAYEGESYNVAFKKPAKYKLKVTASNPVSSQSQQILLTVDEMAPLAEPEFLFVREIVAVNVTHLYTLRVKVDISTPVTFRWDFGDSSGTVTHIQSAPCQTMEGLVERGEKEVYAQDSVNHTYSIPDDYTLHVHVSNQYDNIGASMKIYVRPELSHVHISSLPPVPLVKQTLLLEAFAEPSTYVFYMWDFGDGSKTVHSNQNKVNHYFGSAGFYNVTVCANNTFTTLTSWLMLDVMEKISGLTINYSEPCDISTATEFKAQIATGTSLIWDFDFGDGSLQGNLTSGSVSHIYKFPGNYTVVVTVSNSVSQAHQSIRVEVYSLAISGVLPAECVEYGKDIQLTALVTGQISILIFHWQFGDGSPLTVVTGQSSVIHSYSNVGIFHVGLTVFSSITSVAFNASVCVQAPITGLAVQSTNDVVVLGEAVCFRVVVYPEDITDYQLKWCGNFSSLTSKVENSQQCFVFADEGVEEVSVLVSNKVSNKTAKVSITIQKPVSNLSLVHDSQSDTMTVDTLVSFWVANCTGSNVSVLWDFGDGSPGEQKQNVSHVFRSPGRFTVTATASNMVSRNSTSLKVNVLLPVAELSLHTEQPYAAVGEETLVTALSSPIPSINYYWTVDGITSNKKGTNEFNIIFPKPGVYQVRVVAQNLVSSKEASLLIEVFERINGLRIECQRLSDMKYIPTQEELLFNASITTGSNVTYRWLAVESGIDQEITGDGQLFQLFAKNPGGISLQLRASNKLGEATSNLFLKAVERVTSVHITAQSNILASGKLVNISVSMVTGSNLEYLWYVNSDPSPRQTQAPFLFHTFTSLGHCVVTVSVQNVFSQCNDTKQFTVQEEIQEVDFQIEGKTHPIFINTSFAAVFHGLIQKGSDLQWDWKVAVAKTNFFNAINQTFIYIFSHVNTYNVSLNVSNGINWQIVSHSVTVQDGIEGLLLNISKFSLCTDDEVTFIPTVSKGTNVSYVITIKNTDWIHSQAILNGQFSTSNLPAGKHLVTVKTWNLVSSAEVSSRILVTEKIEGLHLVNCCSTALEALKGIHFKAGVQSGFPVNYTWIIHLVGSKSVSFMGQEAIFTPQESGILSVSVTASNGVCSQMINETLSVEWPITDIKVICYSERIFVGYTVRFSATVNGGSNVQYLWDFGDSTEALVTDLSTVNHTYYTAGKYMVMAKVLSSINHVSTQLHIQVEELDCSIPQASLVQSQAAIYRSRPSFFEANVDINCSSYKTIYIWEICKGSDCTNGNIHFCLNNVLLRNQVNASSPFLLLPKHSLKVGQYCLVFTVSLQGTPVFVQRTTSITVLNSPLVAVIKGGSHKVWPSLSDLTLDGSESIDPDVEPGEEHKLEYHWTFMRENSTDPHLVKQPIGSNSNKMTVPNTQLHPGTVYIFTLTVHKAGRNPASVNQTVTVCEAPVIPVSVECVSCSAFSSTHHISSAASISILGQCGKCDDQTQYKWTSEDQTGVTLDLDEVTTSTGRHSPNLVVRPGVLQPGLVYTFTLNVSQPARGQWGSASLTILPKTTPHGGLCDLSPKSGIRLLETVVTYTCSGWQGDGIESSQLIYTLQVAPCQSYSAECPVLTLYRGTRLTFGSLVPMGYPGQGNHSVISVTLLVEDYLGSAVIALNRTLRIENPPSDEVASQWLRKKSQTELWALVQHGNPQEIIPYSIALLSQLNRLQSEGTTRNLTDRREIRANVSQALASLPVSSLLDVDQISAALAQSTAVPQELVCTDCQVKVLEAVGKMIHMMETQKSPGVLSALETGRNILNIIGCTLAAMSESSTRSSSQPVNSVQSASTVTLSALAHAGALMRSLMHSRTHGEEPLFLSTPYVSTVAFQGDPSDLLCSYHTNPFNQQQILPSQLSSNDTSKRSHLCQFHIPTSLIAHLKSQRSEVVQVLLGMDGVLKSSPMLSAADPPISTSLAAMEFTTPQGEPIPIEDLDLEQAIEVSLPNKDLVGQRNEGEDGRADEDRNGLCLTVTIPTGRQLNFTVQTVDGLHGNAGLYISFNFSLVPGATPVNLGHVKIEVSSTSQDSFERDLALTLSSQTSSSEETIFLSPLMHGADGPLSVNLTSSWRGGGPVHVSVCVFSSLCQYYNERERQWSSEGLKPLEGSTLHTARCLTQHLTMFGASLLLHPGAVVLLPPSGGPIDNIVAGMVCAVLVLIHLIVGLIAHKLDHLDSLRLSQVPLCGQPGLYHYRVLVKTGWRRGAGTTAHVGISLYGVNKSGSRHLQREGAFQRGSLDQFHLETDHNLGEVWKIRIWHDNTGLDPSWYVQHVVVWDPQTDHMFFFLVEDWLSVDNQRNETVEREILASCPEELTQFRRVFTSQLVFGVIERHLWLSLWQRPTHSCFTRGQRVTCSALVLHLYLALGSLWYGALGLKGNSGPVSARLLVSVETVALGMTFAVLVFPLQCFLCFLFRKTQSQVTVDVSNPPSSVCHSVEMDIYFGQSDLLSPSLSLPESSSHVRNSLSSLLESKVFDSSILDFWAASGLVPQTDQACQDKDVVAWSSCDNILSLPVDLCPAKITLVRDLHKNSPSLGPHRLRRKKALIQLPLASDSSPDQHTPPGPSPSKYHLLEEFSDPAPSPTAPDQRGLIERENAVHTNSHNLTTFLTQSEEDLLMSIAAAEDSRDSTNSNSDSGRDSPRTMSSSSATQSISCSSWSDQSDDKSLYGVQIHTPDLQSHSTDRRPSVETIDSVASTFLPSPSPDSTHSSTTRIGVARGQPSWLLPPWALCVIYPLVAVLLGTCLAVVGLYGSFFSRSVVLMWLVSVFSAFLTSALLLEPLKVCVQALIYTVLWRPVDPEVEDQLAQEITVVRAFGGHRGKVRPPCGYGLLQAKEEARKVQALRSLMRHCVCQLFFVLLVLMVNYQDSIERSHGRLLHSSIRGLLHTAPAGIPNLTSLTDWSDAKQWIGHTLVPHLHQNPSLHLVGLPQLQYTRMLDHAAGILLGNSSGMTHRLLGELHMHDWSKKMFKSLSIDFTHYHRESGLFVCVSIKLEWAHTRLTPFLTIKPLLIPSSSSGLDLQAALMVLLLISAVLILFGELWSMVSEHAQYLHQCRHWFQLLLALLSLVAAILHFCFLSYASSCFSKLRSQADNFIDFHRAALLAERSSQCAAVLLMLLVLKLLGTLRFVRRWVVIGRVLQRAWEELWCLIVLLLLLLMLCTHLGNMLFSHSAEGFQSVHQAGVSVLSVLRGRVALQRLCTVQTFLGSIYGLLLIGGLWLLVRLCGAVLIRTYRAGQAELYHPTIEPQDYEMVEFFIKRLKLWMGLAKAKEFRHRVKFEGMDIPPSRSSQESSLSTFPSPLSSSHSPTLSSSFSSPCPLSSALSVRSEDSSVSEAGFDVSPYLGRLVPCVTALLFHFDRVNQISEDIHNLEIRLEEVQARRRDKCISKKEKVAKSQKPMEQQEVRETGDLKQRKTGPLCPKPCASVPSSISCDSFRLHSSTASTCIFPHTLSSYSESESESGVSGLGPAGSPSRAQFPRRKAWYSGSSHSADAAQRGFQLPGAADLHGNIRKNVAFTSSRPMSEDGVRRCISDGIPLKRKAWICEGLETEQGDS